jgi:putative tricarboxylic transport membrane protein
VASASARPARQIRHAETALNVVGVAVGLGIAATAQATGVWDAAGPGSGFLGLLAGLAIALAGAALLWSGAGRERRFALEAPAARRILAIVAALAAIALLLPPLGFVTASILTLVALLPLIERQSWAMVAGFSVVATLVVYWVFDRLLGATLPVGPLGF